MKKQIALFTIMAAALIAVPANTQAQTTNSTTPAAPATTAEAPVKHKKTDATEYHGKVAAIDTAGSTITVGEHKITVATTTKISKDGKKATLADFAVGDKVSGSYKKDAAGDLIANSLREGKKADNGTKKKKANE